MPFALREGPKALTTGPDRPYAPRMIDQETRRLALQTFKDVLNDTSAKATDKIRAAEGIFKLEAEEKDQGLGDVLDASDEELLNRARGTHDLPPPIRLEDDNPAQ